MKKSVFKFSDVITAGVMSLLFALNYSNANAAQDIDVPVFGTNRPPVQVFYVPMPEDHVLTALKAISAGQSTYLPKDPMQTYVSIAVFTDNTVIYYDHWENGFERDIANPNNLYSASNPGGTQIWGDGDPSNGFPPGYPNDILSSGDVIILNNAINSSTRQSVIDWDAGDKIGATKPIAVTRAVWATGSGTLLAGANEVYDTVFFGTRFDIPVGTDTPDSNQMFEYTGLMIMASADNTEVKVDKDRNGTYETVTVINEGETCFINGGVKRGGVVLADKPVQVDLLTGDIGSFYESRFMRVLPTSMWTSAMTTPVGTPARVNNQTSGTKVWLYNPNSRAITVRYMTRSSYNAASLTTNTTTVAANGNRGITVGENVGMRFVTADGAPFYAISTTDATGASGANEAWDWGCTLVPDDALTSQVLVGLGIGRDPTSSVNPNENASPAWVTPIGNGNRKVKVYVDYDGDPSTGAARGYDAAGNKYDAVYELRELQGLKVYNPSGDQTGILIYTLDTDVKLAAMWGSDPKTASTGSPGLDFGTGIPPLPAFYMQKTSKLHEDDDGDGYITPNDIIRYDVMIENVGRQPVTDISLQDTLPDAVIYIPNTTNFEDSNHLVSPIPDDPEFPLTTPYLFDSYLPVGGVWHVTYDTWVQAFDANSGMGSIVNRAVAGSGGTIYTNGVVDELRGRIGDYVWLDSNMNGIQDAAEEGVNGITVRLYNSDGTPAINDFDEPYEFVTRDDGEGGKGFYLFTGVRSGNYYVAFELPSGYAFTQKEAGFDATTDSDVDPATGSSEVFNLDGGQLNLDVDAGLIKLGQISGSVFIDQNGNGEADPEDTAPIYGVTVELLDSDGNVIATTTTAADGSYEFAGLLPGEYTVRQIDGEGWVSSLDTDGDNDNLISVNLPFGGESGGNNFYDTMPVTIGDRVWLDSNRNGIQNNGEPGLAGVTVELYDADGNLVATTTTDANGNYLFENRNPGTYSVKFIPPRGYIFTTRGAGNNDARDSDANVDGSTDQITLTYGTVNLKMDAGLYQLAAAVAIVKTAGDAPDGDTLTINGSEDVEYTYLVTNTGETWLSDIAVEDDILGEVGLVTGPLAPGESTSLTKTATAVSADVVNIGTVTATPTDSDGNVYTGLDEVVASDDARVVVIPFASIGDFAWIDLNGNGIQDGGEVGLPGVTVVLYQQGNVVASTVTDGNGHYLFENLLEGSYSVGFQAPYGYSLTVAKAGGDTGKDSDPAIVSGLTASFLLSGGENRTDIDAGFVKLTAAVEIIKTAGDAADGTVLSFQGVQDVVYTYLIRNTGATYLSNLVVTDDKLGAVGTIAGPLAPGASATLTAAANNVAADVVNIGTVVATPSDSDGTPIYGFENVQDDDDAAVEVIDYSLIGDFVWNDLNRDGIQDANEPGIAGVVVKLYNNGVEVAATVTDSNGYYEFSNLLEGDYTLEFIPPSHYLPTARDQGTDDARDSDIGSNGRTDQFNLPAGAVDRSRDAGFYRPNAAVEIVKTAGDAADGETLTVNGKSDVVYTYVIRNVGETYLSNLVVTDDKLGAIGTIDGPLAPDASQTLTATAYDVAADVVNVGMVVATPADENGVPLDGMENVTADDDAVVVVIPFASIGDFVWNDFNRDGIQDANEPGIAGVVVKLYKDGSVVSDTTTDSNGYYLFEELLAGDYQVGFSLPVGYVPSPADVGSDATDSDVVLTLDDYRTAVFTLEAGANDNTRDAGFYLLQAAVQIIKTAGDAPDGDVLTLIGAGNVVYTYEVRNTGETWLSNLTVVDDKLGEVGTVAGPLAPSATAILTKNAFISEDVVNIAQVEGTPVDSEGNELETLDKVTDSDDAEVVVEELPPPPDATICELLDFGKEFNAVIFGNLTVNGGDTEGNLLVWGDAVLPAGYSVGHAVYGAPMPVAGAQHDALIVGGDLFLGPQSVNGNVVYGGTYSGHDRRYQHYDIRHVSPVTLDADGNVPQDGSGMTAAEMLARVIELSDRIADWPENGVVSKGFDDNGKLILQGNDSYMNVFDVNAWDWSGASFDRIVDVPPQSRVILNIRGADINVAAGRMLLPAGMSPNQVLIHYVDAVNVSVSAFDHEGAILAVRADASFSGGGVQGMAIMGGNVDTSNGAEFHNFSLDVFDCPPVPSVRLIVTANDAGDGDILRLIDTDEVVVHQVIINDSIFWLRSISLVAADGSEQQIADLPPGGVAVVETVFGDVTEAVTYSASVLAKPTNAAGDEVEGYPSVADIDIAMVVIAAEEPENPDTEEGSGGQQPTSKADLAASDIWFHTEPTIIGDSFKVSVRVENKGSATSSGGVIELYLVDLDHPLNQPVEGDAPVGTLTLGTFIPDEVKVFTFNNLEAQGVSGHYRVVALVDYANVIDEWSKGDNHNNLTYSLAGITVSINVGVEGVTLNWNNYWGQTYSILSSPDLDDWSELEGYTGIPSARDVDGSLNNSVTIPLTGDACFYRLRVDQQ